MQEITNCSSLIFELIMCFFFITTLLLVRKIMTGDKFHMEEIQQHKTKTLKKHLTKHETRQEAFERLYGKTPLFKDEQKQLHKYIVILCEYMIEWSEDAAEKALKLMLQPAFKNSYISEQNRRKYSIVLKVLKSK